MPRYFAFLRGINVGGHKVTMDRLRALFEELGFARVETFIASGNVIFDAPAKTAAKLEPRIEAHLEAALGYAVPTFLRTHPDLVAIAAHPAFPPNDVAQAHAIHVSFLREPPAPKLTKDLLALRSPVDEFHVHGREMYWLCRVSILESKVSDKVLGKAFPVASTARNMNTIRRIVSKYE